jgi:hypothetical protein
VRSSARGGSRSAPRRVSVTANLPWQILGAKGGAIIVKKRF